MPLNPKVAKSIFTLCRVLLFCLGCAIILAASSRLTQELPNLWSQLLLAVIAGLGAFGLTLLFVRWEGLQLFDVGVVPQRHSISRLLIGFIMGLFLATLHVMLVLISGHVKLILSPEVRLSSLGITLLLYLLLACREEIAFHGYPLRSLNYAIGAWGAQLIVALIFAVEHVAGGLSWTHGLLGAGVGSLLFGIAALKTKGLALPIGLHAAWNFGQWSLGFKNEPGIWQAVIEKGYEGRVEHSVTINYLLVMGLAMVAFYYFWNRAGKNSSDKVTL